MARLHLPLTLREYLHRTRGRGFSVIIVVSLLCVYEFGLLVGGDARRNAADVVLRNLLRDLSEHGIPIFHGFLLFLFLFAVVSYVRRARSVGRYLIPFFAECLLYAVLLAPAIFFVVNPNLEAGGHGDLLLDLGAGVYEELLFRLLILRGAVFLMGVDPYVAFFDEDTPRASALATAGTLLLPIVLSAFLFAAYHHIGENGDPWVVQLFTFRFVAGLLLALLFFTRGLAVCVVSHGLYDVLIHLAQYVS